MAFGGGTTLRMICFVGSIVFRNDCDILGCGLFFCFGFLTVAVGGHIA